MLGTGFLAVLEGFVWEEGDTFRPMADVKVRYTSDGVSTDVTTDQKGYFKFVNVGPDSGVLDLTESQWQSGTGGVIVKPPVGQTLRANLAALPKGKALAAKLTFSMSTSASGVAAGQLVTFTLKVTNGTQVPVAGLHIGDQLPEGMTVAGVTASRGDVTGQESVVAFVDLNTLGAGESATVNIVALVDPLAKTVSLANRATVFYREGPAQAAQSGVNVTGGPVTLPVTGLGAPLLAAAILVVALIVARQLRARPVG